MSEFKSIDELMEGKKPGEVKLITNDSDSIFTPYYREEFGEDGKPEWAGRYSKYRQIEDLMSESATARIWVLFEEPKKKVKRWLWAHPVITVGFSGPKWYIGDQFCSEKEALAFFTTCATKLLWSETEFDV